jgi:hypothetical protein
MDLFFQQMLVSTHMMTNSIAKNIYILVAITIIKSYSAMDNFTNPTSNN